MAKMARVELKGPLFSPGMVGVFRGELVKGLVSLGDEAKDEATKRFKKGKGRRTGALANSFSNARQTGPLSAGVSGTSSEVERYYHRVEYGSRHMKGQHQRKNARAAIIRSLNNPLSPRSQKLIARAVERLN